MAAEPFHFAPEIDQAPDGWGKSGTYDELFSELHIGPHRLPNINRFLRAPLILPARFGNALHRAACDVAQQAVVVSESLASNQEILSGWPDAIRNSVAQARCLPPPFIQVDFALSMNDDNTPGFQLIEIQAFPSIMATLYLLASWQQHRFALSQARCTSAELPIERVVPVLRDCILGGCAPQQVALIEVQPSQQVTYHDLLAHQYLLGLPIVDFADLESEMHSSRVARVRSHVTGTGYRRLFNRVVFEEAAKHGLSAKLTELIQSDVTWASHPAWYFLISKVSLPFIKHPTVPPSFLCSSMEATDRDLNKWCLKPLYSFAGQGVQVGPQGNALNMIPEKERGHWLLQRRVDYAPLIETPAGRRTIELRVMLVWNQCEPTPQVSFTFFRMNTEPKLNIRQMKDPFTGCGLIWFQ